MDVKYEFEKGFFENFKESPSFHNSRPPKMPTLMTKKEPVRELYIIAAKEPRSIDINEIFNKERKSLAEALQRLRGIEAKYQHFYDKHP